MDVINITKIGGIKCDNQNCNYADASVPVSDYSKWINKPCPVCGSNLLTEDDYTAFMKMYKGIQGLNRILGMLPGAKKVAERNSRKETAVKISFDGSGKTNVSVK